ncbi:putative phage tail protein [Kiloniella majae]|uniref:putative phage tail protein n=1 Tax=Kiloniella majae TaxID=1938558 RepID=UPI000A2791D9|nr:putative phage tail protein [Kiloniella majae]
MSRSTQDYQSTLVDALPQGAAFPREDAPNRDGILTSVATEFSTADALMDKLLVEADPRTTQMLLPEWEEDYGLPDCQDQDDLTFQERKAILNEKINRVGSLNVNAIKALTERFGVEIEVIERKPFIAGRSRCGDRLAGGASVRYWWSVNILEPRITPFRCGQSHTGEKLLSIRRAKDLECILNKMNHSDTLLAVGYD